MLTNRNSEVKRRLNTIRNKIRREQIDSYFTSKREQFENQSLQSPHLQNINLNESSSFEIIISNLPKCISHLILQQKLQTYSLKEFEQCCANINMNKRSIKLKLFQWSQIVSFFLKWFSCLKNEEEKISFCKILLVIIVKEGRKLIMVNKIIINKIIQMLIACMLKAIEYVHLINVELNDIVRIITDFFSQREKAENIDIFNKITLFLARIIGYNKIQPSNQLIISIIEVDHLILKRLFCWLELLRNISSLVQKSYNEERILQLLVIITFLSYSHQQSVQPSIYRSYTIIYITQGACKMSLVALWLKFLTNLFVNDWRLIEKLADCVLPNLMKIAQNHQNYKVSIEIVNIVFVFFTNHLDKKYEIDQNCLIQMILIAFEHLKIYKIDEWQLEWIFKEISQFLGNCNQLKYALLLSQQQIISELIVKYGDAIEILLL